MIRRWENYPLQEKEPDPVGGEGDPPKDPPPKEGDDKDPPKEPATISLDALPADLRDKPEAEVKFLLEHMITSLGSRNTQVEELQTQVAELRGAVNVKPPAEPDPDDEKSLEELMLEDSGKAIERYLTSKGYVGAVG